MTRPARTRPARRPASASGRFLLRIEPGLHAVLRTAAREAGVSLNDYCARKLAAPMGNLTALTWATASVERAAALFGEAVVGVVAYGSWARGEAADGSDIDVLVILERGVPLRRALYQTWDEAPVQSGARPVEPHFVHLPGAGATAAGLWAEVALDGLVLFERGLRVSALLALVRREIVAGRIVRRFVHGQPCWITEVA